MKKWLVILCIIFGISFITSAILAGQVYYKELNTYTDHNKQKLDQQALDNIFIKSDVPIEIIPVAESGYVEFSQTFIDLLGFAPEYELQVEQKDNNTYIDLVRKKESMIYLGIQSDRAVLSVYLPQQTYDSLSIKNTEGYYRRYEENYEINLDGINIDNLELDIDKAQVNLKGIYQSVSISMETGILNMASDEMVRLETKGSMNIGLTGKYESISIQDCYNRNINIDSEQPTTLQMNGKYATVKLRGKYEKISLQGDENVVDARSENICKLMVGGVNNKYIFNGAFQYINLNVPGSEIELQTTVIPEQIKILGEIYNTVSITLPSNITGFKVIYEKNKPANYNGGQNDFINEEDMGKSILSDFNIEQSLSKINEWTYSFGDESIPITFDDSSDFSLRIIDGGYTSKSY